MDIVGNLLKVVVVKVWEFGFVNMEFWEVDLYKMDWLEEIYDVVFFYVLFYYFEVVEDFL